MDTHTPSQAGIGIATPVCYSEIGAKANQEDALFPLTGEATAQQRVFLVCDGMGGHEHGEVASQCGPHRGHADGGPATMRHGHHAGGL